MKKIQILAVACAAVVGACATITLSSCGNNANGSTYKISQHYTDDNKGDIPSDAVNQVMFAYSETCDVTFTTELTLNKDNNTYVLYKDICTAEIEMDDGTKQKTYHGGYEFKGTYTVGADANHLTLNVPTEARYFCYYPTVLNYQSIEKQTQDWVSSQEAPFILTRFNNWYPAKKAGTVAQEVTLSGKTLSFGSFNIEVEKPSSETPAQSTSEAPAEESSEAVAEKEVKISVEGTKGTTLVFYTDKTYEWIETAHNLKEEGTFLINESHQIELTCTKTGTTITSTLNTEDNSQSIHFEPSSMGGYASALADDFVLQVGQWGQLTLLK